VVKFDNSFGCLGFEGVCVCVARMSYGEVLGGGEAGRYIRRNKYLSSFTELSLSS
jgi:hypothetical protein